VAEGRNATGNDSHFHERVGEFEVPAAYGMPGSVGGDYFFLFRRDDFVFLFEAADHTVDGIVEVFHFHFVLPFTGGDEGGFVTYVGDVRTGEAGGHGSELLDVEVGRRLDGLQVYVEDMFTAEE